MECRMHRHMEDGYGSKCKIRIYHWKLCCGCGESCCLYGFDRKREKGIPYHAKIVDTVREEETVSCAVIKDGGSDPDVTTGCHVFATVQLILESALEEPFVEIDGGEGVGRVTLPGLDQPIGNAAINHVPRQMIEKEVLEVCRLCDYHGGISVLISVPEGRELAEKTFNPRLGIVDGISILGTSGIVEPMSSKALLDTIQVELKQKKALGFEYAAVSPGKSFSAISKSENHRDL